MTMQEYLGTRQLERLPSGSVEVAESDIKNFWLEGQDAPEHMRQHSGILVELKDLPKYTYFVPEDGYGILWTMDHHGNRKARSVFKLKDSIQHYYAKGQQSRSKN